MNINKKKLITLFIFLGFIINSYGQSKAGRPNIILILSDDMGYSDLGCYGSNIQTPNLDALAKDGIKYTQFYNEARCCPSRASLMTGLYPHQTGIGWMTGSDQHLPGYRGDLNNHCVTIAQVLRQAGYSTYMVGKWHLSGDKTGRKTKKNWPLQRGFHKFYGIIKGAANYYDPGTLCRGNELISPFNDPKYKPKHYYFTNAITDNAVKFIEEDKGTKPFFICVAYTAAHWPMQAPANAIQEYKGKYDEGWNALRHQRLAKMKRLGVIGENTELPPLDTHPWSEEKHKEGMERRMETYAAMITVMDQGIGKIVSELKRKGIYKNTIILFMEDNGGNAEVVGYGGSNGETRPEAHDTAKLRPLAKEAINLSNNPRITRSGKVVMEGLDLMAGPGNTYVSYLKPWAEVSNTPFKEYKHFVHEGGIATPLIICWPEGIKKTGEIRKQVSDVIDIMPTLLQLADATYPAQYKGNAITPVAGVSLTPTFNSNKPLPERTVYWEHEMNRAVRWGKWKLVSPGNLLDGHYGTWKYYINQSWELYDMSTDRSELKDLSGQYPNVVKKMAAMWNKWAHTHNVFPAPWKKVIPSLQSYYTTDQIKGNINLLKDGYKIAPKESE